MNQIKKFDKNKLYIQHTVIIIIIIIFIPIFIFLFLVLTQKEYMKIYWSNPLGVVVLIFVGLLMSIGWVWMKKVVEIKV